MTDHEYALFVSHFRELRLGSLDFGFVLAWRDKLDGFVLADLIVAVEDTAADSRASFPLNDLPLLIEHANSRRDFRARNLRTLKPWGPRPPSSEFWDGKMLENGVIDQQEFDRRQADRKGNSA